LSVDYKSLMDHRAPLGLSSALPVTRSEALQLSRSVTLDTGTKPGLLMLEIDAEEVGLRRTVCTDEVVRRTHGVGTPERYSIRSLVRWLLWATRILDEAQ